MSTPDVPLRHEFVIELPGTPEQVWQAIADRARHQRVVPPVRGRGARRRRRLLLDGPRPGLGRLVSGWEPPVRLEYSEPDWAALVGHAGAPVTPMVSEFVVEASSGGTCVLRVTSSGFGTGAEWERSSSTTR